MDHQPVAATATKPDEKSIPGGGNEIDRLLALGKCKQAVELAKEQHKRQSTPESHRQLLSAYIARIEQFQSKGMAQEADALIALVRERFPAQRDRLASLSIRAAAASGRIGELVAPLASAQTPPEIRAEIESAIRQKVIDVAALASCDALAAEHPLRIGAGAVAAAFEAATSGPVEDAQIALPQISHRSPLAPWKLLVRAIAAFYRHDDAGCRKALDAIAPDAAAHQLVPVIDAMLRGSPVTQGMAGVLYQRVVENLQPLRKALESIEQAFAIYDLDLLRPAVRDAMRASHSLGTQFQERLRQHISIAALLHDLDAGEIIPILGTTRKDAHFWRLLAKAEHSLNHNVGAAFFWERFLRHSVQEGMLKPGTLEEAAVWKQVAMELSELSAQELREGARRTQVARIIELYYEGQPPEIAALKPRSQSALLEEVLTPGGPYRRAVAIDPDPGTFRQWWEWATRTKANDNSLEQIARLWHEKNPRDPEPLLHLCQLAEKRKAFKTALDRLDEAEKLDPLNPQVRQARVRLSLATLWRHFKQKKPDLVARDLSQIEALPAMQEPDRVAFVGGLRAAWRTLRNETTEAQQALDALVEKMGRLAGGVIFQSIARKAGLPQESWPTLPDFFDGLEPREVLAAEARAVRISFELETPLLRPTSWNSMIDQALQQRPVTLSEADLLRVGRAAILWTAYPRAYLVSTVGLSISQNPAATARFLLLRSQSLWCAWMQKRSVQCLRAALELARQAHDEQLIGQVLAALDRHEQSSRALFGARPRQNLDAELLAEVLKSERAAVDFPVDPQSAERFLVALEAPEAMDDQQYDQDQEQDDSDDYHFGELDVPIVPNLEQADVDKIDEFLRRRGVSPEQLFGNKKLLGELLAELVKNKVPDFPFDQFEGLPWDQPFGSFGGGHSGRRRKRRKKR